MVIVKKHQTVITEPEQKTTKTVYVPWGNTRRQ